MIIDFVNHTLTYPILTQNCFKGPPSGRPKIPSRWDIFQKRKEIAAELNNKFLLNFVKEAGKSAVRNELKMRTKWITDNVFGALIDSTIDDMIEGTDSLCTSFRTHALTVS